MDKSLLGEFQLDWTLAGKSEQTAKNYVRASKMGRHSEGNLAVGKPGLGACLYCTWWARNWLKTSSGLALS